MTFMLASGPARKKRKLPSSTAPTSLTLKDVGSAFGAVAPVVVRDLGQSRIVSGSQARRLHPSFIIVGTQHEPDRRHVCRL
jgi:hypothetical protein